MRDYNVLDWYWLADDGRVYASARNAVVDKTDAAFVAREAEDGFTVTRWPVDEAGAQSAASMQDVVKPYGLTVPGALSLTALQASLSTDIDAQAESQRLKYITPGEAQMATYLLKRGQALQALAAQAANTTANMTSDALAAAYPYLANEIGITVDPTSKTPATDIYGVARAVQAVAAVWQTLDLAIEKARLATKAAIAAATTVAAAQTAHDAVAWPAPPSA